MGEYLIDRAASNSPHDYLSKNHCLRCAAAYANRYYKEHGGKGGQMRRNATRALKAREILARPERYKRSRGLIADLETGLVYGKLLKPVGTEMYGYLRIPKSITDDGHSVAAHIVVWEAANGPVPDGLELNHKNGVKSDNRLCNLEAVTPSENVKHSYDIGLASNAGENHPGHKLTEADVRDIRRLKAEGASTAALGDKFSMSLTQIKDIVRHRSWAHVEGETA